MSNDALAVVEEITARLQRGRNPVEFLACVKEFLKWPHRWRSQKDVGTVLSVAEITRVMQAGTIWRKLGQQVFGVSLSEYLYGTDALDPIPSLPDWPKTWGEIFDHDTLVDGRIIEKIGMSELCRLLGLAFDGDDKTFVAFVKKQAQTGIRWMRHQNGHKNYNRTLSACRETFESFEVGMDAGEAIAVYVQDPVVINGHFIDVLGSVRADDRGRCAVLGRWGDSPGLGWSFNDCAFRLCGSASRGSV